MKHLYILLLCGLVLPFQVANAETLSLEAVIEQALQNSPETARILKTVADANAEAFEIETPDNPSVEIDVTAIEDDASRSIVFEFEQIWSLLVYSERLVI